LQLSLTSGLPAGLDAGHSPALISVCDARRNVRRLLASGKIFLTLPRFLFFALGFRAVWFRRRGGRVVSGT
jgi:hypothetical protein